MTQDLFQAPDYYQLDDLLTEEHKLVRNAAREWVKREVSPIIEDAAQEAKFPKQLLKGLAGNWCIWTLYSRRIWRCRIRSNVLWFDHAGN